MFNLEQAIQTWKQFLNKSPAFEEGQIKEMETHLRDHIDHLVDKGLPEEEAFRRAAEKFGPVEEIEDEVYKTKTTKPDATSPWKQKSWIPILLPNYLKVAYRQLIRFKTYSAINIGGLAVGIACFLIIALYVRDELGFDKYHSNSEQIYRVTTIVDELSTPTGSFSHAGLPRVATAFAPILADRIPEIEQVVRLNQLFGEQIMAYGENAFSEENIYYAEPSLFEVFDIEVIHGDPAGGLNRPQTLFISESAARKYFGDENPVGETMIMNDENDFEVTGIFSDLPDNSHLSFDFLLSYETLNEESRNSWRQSHITYISTRLGADIQRLRDRFSELPGTLQNESEESSPMSRVEGLGLMPLHDIHLYSQTYLAGGMNGQGDIRYVYLFAAVAFLILLIAGINYINITTARASQRGREVGVRKAVGAVRKQLIFQFIGESVLVMFLAAMCGILLAELALPVVNGLVGRTLEFSFADDGNFWGMLSGIILAVVLISGAYSAFVLSRFNPVRVIKGELGVASWNVTRKVLVVFQFGISTVLVIATLVMFYQLQFLQNKNLGFNQEQVLSIPTQGALGSQAEVFKSELLNIASVQSVTLTQGVPGNTYGIHFVDTDEFAEYRGDESSVVLYYFRVDEDFQRTYETGMASGRMFSSEYSTDVSGAAVINEAAARKLGWNEDAVGKHIQVNGNRQVIGVMKDFHFQSLKSNISPMVMTFGAPDPGYVSVRVGSEDLSGTIGQIQNIWEKIAPAHPFTYSFMDQKFDNMYRAEKDLGNLFGIFTLLAVCIASLGLFGMASFITQKRMKEIGIRKILGAKFRHIIGLLSRDFMVLLAISFAIAVPATWYYMNQWLTNFAYRIDFGLEIFMAAAAISVLIIALSIGWHAIRATGINPVAVIRKE